MRGSALAVLAWIPVATATSCVLPGEPAVQVDADGASAPQRYVVASFTAADGIPEGTAEMLRVLLIDTARRNVQGIDVLTDPYTWAPLPAGDGSGALLEFARERGGAGVILGHVYEFEEGPWTCASVGLRLAALAVEDGAELWNADYRLEAPFCEADGAEVATFAVEKLVYSVFSEIRRLRKSR